MRQGTRVTQGIQRGQRIEIEVDGEPVEAFLGEPVAAALIVTGWSISRVPANRARPCTSRGVLRDRGLL
jgi:2Fe-2S iron-sulfur cluster protein